MNTIRLIFTGYIVSSFLLLLFSYTQVDLNLTLSQVGTWHGIQNAFQQIGFYHRPLSTFIYVLILSMFFLCYVLLLHQSKKGSVGVNEVWKLILFLSLILFLAYPAAFSYDFFNYLFTAKTVLVYNQNPYSVTPLLFAGVDPWTNFMRWTHLPSAYTPLWIFISLFPYIFGLGYFILVLFATKALILGCYLLASLVLVRVLKITKANVPFGLVFFALNPLMLLESLVSAHNDIVLVLFALLSVYFYQKKEKFISWVYLALSIATKLMTIVLVPIYIARADRRWMLWAMLMGLGLVLLRREFLPWYWVWVIPFIAINLDKPGVVPFSTSISMGLLLSYVPYIYFGEYSQLQELWKNSVIWVSVSIGFLLYIFPHKKVIQSS